jgi:nucleotide-binding universal stress UspA family protein
MGLEVSDMSATTAMFTLVGIWIGFGLLLALVMGRHGHDPFAWWLLGTLLGPPALPLAVSAERRHAEQAEHLRVGAPGRGPVDVLGSTATTLAARSKVPVLLSGGRPTD